MKENIKKHLGLKVKVLRENSHLTQEELSVICDVSWRTISNLERGLVMPDLLMVIKISQHFEVSLDELLNMKSITPKSTSRLETELLIIEKIQSLDDSLLSYVKDQINLVLKHFG